MILEILVVVLVLALLLSWFCIYEILLKIKEKHTIELIEARKDAVKRSRSTIEGLTFEQLVPHFKEWKYGKPSEARFISSPLDYIVFSGLSEDKVTEIIFVEVKTGDSQTTKRQKSVKDAIKNGKIRYELLEINNDPQS